MLLASTVIPIAARDVVFDPQRDVLYMTPPSGGQIQRWDVATQQLLTPINSGAGYVWGMDITPDGSALIVADGAVQGEFDAIRKVSLDTGVIDTFLYTRDGNVLVVGHSNTVDDIVNGLMGISEFSDLPDTEYGSLFIVKKKGNKYSVEKIKVPQTEPR